MNREQVWREFDALPSQAQQQVVDFIAFLRTRTSQDVTTPPITLNTEGEPFIGMWQDREDLADSSAWVRRLREHEWTRAHGKQMFN